MLPAALCCFAAAARAQAVPLRIPQAVIVRAAQPENDLNLRAYAQVFEAVSLGWRMVPAQSLASLHGAPGALVLVVPARTARALSDPQREAALELARQGALLVTEEATPLSAALGFSAGVLVEVAQIEDQAYPDIMIVWERPGGVVSLQPPASATVLCREKWTRAPLAASLLYGRGRALLLAAELDPVQGDGFARFPYFIHALRDAGLVLPFRDDRLSALFDYSYRAQVDLEYFARKWRRAGIASLHVGAWKFWEPDPARDDYLNRLIAACHRNGILVHAWLEFPHVSEEFWNQHPQWREKTAVGQDAQLDWRYLMNLKDPECFRAVADGLRRLLVRFDWDGVNLGELYFESPRGPESPDRFTPLNATVRAEFKTRFGFDPLELFDQKSPRYWKRDAPSWKKFVDYRVEQVRALNERFLALVPELEDGKRSMALALTFVDNLYDPKMREAIGADAKQMLPLLEKHDFTLILEDPGTVWHLGPRRYTDLAQSYAKLTPRTGRLGIDINVVERWQDVYPTKKQTGVELLELFHHAARNFRTVLVYFEQSILSQDLATIAHALAAEVSGENEADAVKITSRYGVTYDSGLEQAAFRVDGKPWPCADGGRVLLPAGEHRVQAEALPAGDARPRLVKLNGELRTAAYAEENAIQFSYAARARAIALFDRPFKTVLVDGHPLSLAAETFVMLPAGEHRVTVRF
jgi:hypothetical protein